MRRTNRTAVFNKRLLIRMIVVVSTVGLTAASAGINLRLTRSRCCIPNYGYGRDYHRRGAGSYSKQGVATTVARGKLTGQRTLFIFPDATSAPITMSSAAAALYSNGDLRFSCRLNRQTYDKRWIGSDLSLSERELRPPKFDPIRSSCCTVRLEFLSGPPSLDGTRASGPILFQTSRSVRVYENNQPVSFRLTSEEQLRVRRHISEITHVRLYLEYRLDR